jgi:lysophospholipase L1-like esterase
MQLIHALPLVLGLSSIALAFGGATAPQDAKPQESTPPTSVVAAPRTDEWAIKREAECIKRAKESAPVHVVFVGDSITQGWEDGGKDAWTKHIAPLGALNLGNSGDRTENVLHRLAQAPLTRLKAKHVVLLIGTNNLGHGTSNAAETLAGMRKVAETLHAQCEGATIHILEIFPRGERFNAMRGDICQINQALRAFVRDDADRNGGKTRYRIDALGDGFLNADGSISKDIMPDALHLSPKGYQMWAEGIFRKIAK